ncbi:MAG TPA: hypothetical protein DF383_11820 [Deltaproteobacteria bacterium]|nr:hypothetical protein [Deltaproteobacteria bacterium]
MSMPQQVKDIQIEFAKPGLNPFLTVFEAHRAQKSELSPLQKLHGKLKVLEKIAEAGEFQQWQEKASEVLALSEEVHDDEIRRLEVQVQIKKFELTLFFNAGKQAHRRAQSAERQAVEAELTENTTASREHWAQAQKWKRLSEYFQEKLNLPTGTI